MPLIVEKRMAQAKRRITEGGLSSPPTSIDGRHDVYIESIISGGLLTSKDPIIWPYFNPERKVDSHLNRLPHWQQDRVFLFVTFRLADALPTTQLKQWNSEKRTWLGLHPEPWQEAEEREYHERFSRRMDKWLDQGRGSCVLREPQLANVVAKALQHFNGIRYELAAFVVMPNHVHVLFRPMQGFALASIVKSWKGFTARQLNKQLGRTGRFWQGDYWDRLIRNRGHFMSCLQYIRENPLKAKLRSGEFVLYEQKVEEN